MNIMSLRPIALLACTAFFAASSVLSAVTVSQSSSAPSIGVYKFQDVPVGGTSANITSYKRSSGSPLEQTMGQGFSTVGLTDAIKLNAVTFYLNSFAPEVQGLGFNLSIYSASAVATAPSVSTLISTQTGTLPSTLTGGNYLTLALDSAIELAADRYYSMVFSFAELTSLDGTAKSISFSTIGSGVSNSALGGRRWIGVDGTYAASASNGLVMYVGATSAVPEPSTYALFFGACTMAAVLFRRARRG